MSSNTGNKTVEDLELSYYTRNPSDLLDLTKDIFTALRSTEVAQEAVRDYLQSFLEYRQAQSIAEAAVQVMGGFKPFSELQQQLVGTNQSQELNEWEFVTDDLEELYSQTYATRGLRWRLETLNRSLGSLRKGDFGFLFARPETGKTTFLASEVTYMAVQASAPILWFNNEEQGNKVKIRCYQAALGLTGQELFRAIDYSRTQYKSITGDRIRIFDSASISRRDIEAVARDVQPALIVIDQIDKIKGFQADRPDLVLGQIYIWARELAKTYCPVIGVCQAGASGEGKKYLQMDDVVDAKTSKQAEADWILGIGKEHGAGMDEVRGLHICKNKLQGDPDSIAKLRHATLDVMIQPQIARYKDVMRFE